MLIDVESSWGFPSSSGPLSTSLRETFQLFFVQQSISLTDDLAIFLCSSRLTSSADERESPTKASCSYRSNDLPVVVVVVYVVDVVVVVVVVDVVVDVVFVAVAALA